MIPSLQANLLHYVDQQILSYLKEWESVTMLARNMDVHGAREVMVKQLHKYGIETQILGNELELLYGQLRGESSRTLLLYQHYNSPALFPDALITSLLAVDAFQKVASGPPVTIKWLLGSTNQLGGWPTHTIIEEHHTLLQADGCLAIQRAQLADDMPALALGTKGSLGVALTVETTSTTVDSIYGAIVPNALWRLTWALGHLKDAREDILIEGFYDTLLPTADDEIALLHALPNDMQPLKQHLHIPQFLLGLQGFQLHYVHLLTPTCTINSITSGTMPTTSDTMIPAQATAHIDFHLVPGQDPYDIFAKLCHHLQSQGFGDIQPQLLYASQPMHTPLNDAFITVVRRATSIAYGADPYLLPLTTARMALYPLRQTPAVPVVIARTGYVEPNAHAAAPHHVAAAAKQIILTAREMVDAVYRVP